MVHISQLKRRIPPSVAVDDDISAVPDDPMASVQPVHFLDSQMVKKGASNLSQIKVQWSRLPRLWLPGKKLRIYVIAFQLVQLGGKLHFEERAMSEYTRSRWQGKGFCYCWSFGNSCHGNDIY